MALVGPPSDAPDRPVLGASYMLAASAAFGLLGVVVKVASATIPTGEIVWWRSVLSACFVGAAMGVRGRSLRPTNLRMHAVRAFSSSESFEQAAPADGKGQCVG